MEIRLNRKIETVFKICESALRFHEIEIDEINYDNGYILASTKSGLLSWGEDVEIRINSISSIKTSIRLASKAKAQLITWGKNDENVFEISETIKRISKSTQ